MWRDESHIFNRHAAGKEASSLPPLDVSKSDQNLINHLLRKDAPPFPVLSEIDVNRHFTRLSTFNTSVDFGIYPLGSCTMKYNPKINEEIAGLRGLKNIHPSVPLALSQGILEIYNRLQTYLCAITGHDHASLFPSAGSHGEWTGLRVIRAALKNAGNPRKKFLIPDSAHGTNPASAALSCYQTIRVPVNNEGVVDVSTVESLMDNETAGIMLTNPNTLGLFEKNIKKIADVVHAWGGFVYMDGANLNALIGHCRPADIGVDVMHINLHKTFSTPHGGGGPGAGPITCTKKLFEFLPLPVLEKNSDNLFFWNFDRPKSIGRIRANFGNFAVLIKAVVYIESLGHENLRAVSETAILNANYILNALAPYYNLPYGNTCMHEVVFNDLKQTPTNIKTMDIAKRLIDFGVHPPTIYFPLVVHGALMIEPTETETKEELDEFIALMKNIALEAENSPEILKSAPNNAFRFRVDEVKANRQPILSQE